MLKGYEAVLMAMLIEKFALSAREHRINSAVYDIVVSNKSVLAVVRSLVDASPGGGPAFAFGALLRTALHQAKFVVLCAFVFLIRFCTRFIVMKIPIVVYLVAFDYFDCRFYKIANSKGMHDAIVFTLLCVLLAYCARCTVQEAIVFRGMYFQSSSEMIMDK
ncbi:uncharacterized protein NEMAJ01_1316 [Nematocida major]|uniref:uncharacterized protein n=1 Tax=Nematocida major TaxID=1912982 RepID=UPI00200790D4|nr:uncharacterized protein NEMAJ01_1316 [Nematocida major]KAH9386420.1 hypothetical protein NEMAJ01_1316 [Nematocida major]